jgi:hypothetical protein
MLLITDSFEIGSPDYDGQPYSLTVTPISWFEARDMAHDDCAPCLATLSKTARKAIIRELELEGKRPCRDCTTPRKGNRYLVGYRMKKNLIGGMGTRWYLVTIS